jgi:hypothetical protein
VTSDNKKATDIVALILGLIMFAFGFLKLFDPFRTWFHVQIAKGGLPGGAFPLGIAGEILIGLTFIASFVARSRLGEKRYLILAAASLGLVGNMLVVTYVHLQPDVPAEVLPLGIKPPVIPLTVMAVALWELVRVLQLRARAGGSPVFGEK